MAPKSNGRPGAKDQAFAAFLIRANRDTGFDEPKIRELLKQRWDKFYPAETSTYLKYLHEVAEDERSKTALDNARDKLRNRIKHPTTPEACPVCGEGEKIGSRTWGWVCSKGDVRCNLALFLSKRTKLTPQEALEVLNLEWNHYNERVDSELALWKIGWGDDDTTTSIGEELPQAKVTAFA